MEKFAIITDASAGPKTKKGLGAYLFLPDQLMHSGQFDNYLLNQHPILKYVEFENTSSTEAEIKTAIHAISDFTEFHTGKKFSFTLYTDSQNIAKLQGRRPRLEKNDFISKKSGKELKNSALYKEFYSLLDEFGFEIVKVEGHKPAGKRDQTEEIFSYVDRKVREKFRSLK